MKKTFTKILILFIFTSLLIQTVYASDMYSVYDADNNTVEVKGFFDEVDTKTPLKSNINQLIDLPKTLPEIIDVEGMNEKGKSTKVKTRFENIRDEFGDELPVIKPNPAYENKIFVSLDGNDNTGSGTETQPYKTIAKAVQAASQNTTIYIKQGNYILNEEVIIDGKENIFISAYPGDEVTATSGIMLDNNSFIKTVSEAVNDNIKENIYEYDLNLVEGFPSNPSITTMKLTDSNGDYTLARWPNASVTGMERVESDLSEKYPSGKDTGVYDAGPWDHRFNSNVTEDRKVGKDGRNGFEFKIADKHPFTWIDNSDIHMKGSFFAEYITNTVEVEAFDAKKQSVKTYGTWWTASRGAYYSEKNKFYYMNVLDELDVPGEWKIDTVAKKLYVYPYYGTPDNLKLSTNSDMQNLITVKNSNSVTISNINFESLTSTPVNIENSQLCVVQKSTFKNIRGSGVTITESPYSGVIESDFSNTGSNAVIIDSPASINTLVPQYNFVQDNTFSHAGQVRLIGVGHIVSHNYFSNNKSNCVYFYNTRDCYAEYNEFCQSPTEVVDGGVIYGSGLEENFGNHIRYNFINNCSTERSRPFTIYMDEMSNYNTIYGNVILGGGQIYLNNGSENTVFNNIIMGNTFNKDKDGNDVYNYSIEDSVNYIYSDSTVRDNWYAKLKNKIGKFGYLYPQSGNTAIFDNFDDVRYNERYPAFMDISEKMKQRAEEYAANPSEGSDIEAEFSNGADTAWVKSSSDPIRDKKLDFYLRYPRDNYIASNVIVSDINGTSEKQDELKLQDNLWYKKTGLVENNILNKAVCSETLKEAEIYYNNLRETYSYLEEIPFDNIGLYRGVAAGELNISYPYENAIMSADEVIVRWNNDVAVSSYNVELYKNNGVVYSTETLACEIDLTSQSLEPGSYSVKIIPVSQGSIATSGAESVVNFSVVTSIDELDGYITGINLTDSDIKFNFYNKLVENGKVFIAFYNQKALCDIKSVTPQSSLDVISQEVTDKEFDEVHIFYFDEESFSPLAQHRIVSKEE